MTISWLQAALLGLFACLSSMPGLGGTSFGNYTLGRPLIGGLVCGIILGDIKTGILVGAAMQVVYIALVTPGGTVSADVRAVSYIGIPLAMVALNSYGLSAATKVDMVLPWISHILCSFIPALIMCKLGADVVELIKTTLPMDGLAMKTLFTVGSLLPCVGIAILLKQIVTKAVDFIPFFFGFTLAASMGINLVAATVIAGMFALINYKLKMLQNQRVAAPAGDFDDEDEEDI